MYAMVDRMDDIALGVKSTAILFGESDRQIIGLIQGLLLVCLVMIGHQAKLGWIYYLGVCAATVLVAYQQYLIRFREREACFRARITSYNVCYTKLLRSSWRMSIPAIVCWE